MSKEKSKTSPPPASAAPLPDARVSSPAPDLVVKLQSFDNAIGTVEHAFVALSLFSLIGVGTYQFLASRLFGANDTWPFEALRYLVFFCAMGGAALSSQKGRMISMDFVARKLPAKQRAMLRMLVAAFVMFACFLLYRGGMYVRASAAGEEYEVIRPAIALLALPVGALLIGLHYFVHAVCDALYLSAGMLPPEEEAPAAH